ncbi:MAG: trp operon repressor [Holosporales bacterium]|jgi:TrpR-related protein YerC/YecD|nr:trp operon repressor [Holosporales bacterium]
MVYGAKDLFEAIMMLATPKEAERFFADLCTPQEIKAMKERWKVCQLLDCGNFSYREISNITGASTTTVARVSRFLNNEPHRGYRLLTEKIKKENKNV